MIKWKLWLTYLAVGTMLFSTGRIVGYETATKKRVAFPVAVQPLLSVPDDGTRGTLTVKSVQAYWTKEGMHLVFTATITARYDF